MRIADIERALLEAGLRPRGAFHPAPADGVPPLAAGQPARTLLLAGNAGPQMWTRFAAARGRGALTLDQWSEQVLGELAARLHATAVYPFARPHLPFQRWAQRAEACFASPLGLLLHAQYGLWHGYRGALLFADAIELPEREQRTSPCASCQDQPCLAACPVGAFDGQSYDVRACARHLGGTPEPKCMQFGCLARHACPVGRDFRYSPPQARFHMQAFLAEVRSA